MDFCIKQRELRRLEVSETPLFPLPELSHLRYLLRRRQWYNRRCTYCIDTEWRVFPVESPTVWSLTPYEPVDTPDDALPCNAPFYPLPSTFAVSPWVQSQQETWEFSLPFPCNIQGEVGALYGESLAFVAHMLTGGLGYLWGYHAVAVQDAYFLLVPHLARNSRLTLSVLLATT